MFALSLYDADDRMLDYKCSLKNSTVSLIHQKAPYTGLDLWLDAGSQIYCLTILRSYCSDSSSRYINLIRFENSLSSALLKPSGVLSFFQHKMLSFLEKQMQNVFESVIAFGRGVFLVTWYERFPKKTLLPRVRPWG